MQNAMRRSTLVLPADVAKLADAQDSGSCGVTPMEVRFLSSAFKKSDPNGRIFCFLGSHSQCDADRSNVHALAVGALRPTLVM